MVQKYPRTQKIGPLGGKLVILEFWKYALNKVAQYPPKSDLYLPKSILVFALVVIRRFSRVNANLNLARKFLATWTDHSEKWGFLGLPDRK